MAGINLVLRRCFILGVTMIKAEADSKRVTVEWDAPANWDEIKDLLVEIGYPPTE